MAQRKSGFARLEAERYETPGWVTEALLDTWSIRGPVWEPAAGNGHMARALGDRLTVYQSDLHISGPYCRQLDFLAPEAAEYLPAGVYQSIVTNPPFGVGGRTAKHFIELALQRTRDIGGMVATLLRSDFDQGITRSALFGDHPAFAGEIVLLKRIRWISPLTGVPIVSESGAGPSENHRWFLWDWRRSGAPIKRYYKPTCGGADD